MEPHPGALPALGAWPELEAAAEAAEAEGGAPSGLSVPMPGGPRAPASRSAPNQDKDLSNKENAH